MRKGKWGILVLLLSWGVVQGVFAGCPLRQAQGKKLLVGSCPLRQAQGEKLSVDGSQLSVDSWQLPVDSSRIAQQTTDNKQRSTQNPIPRFSLKNGTLSLLDPLAPSFNLAAEHIIRPRLYGHVEAGALFNLRLFDEPTIDNLKGYRLRGAIRYYLRPPQIGNYTPFIEVLYTHQYTDVEIEGDFRRNTDLGRYRQRLTYQMKQREQGGYFNLGLQQIYARRFLFEFGAGLGISHKRSNFNGVPPDATFRTNGSLGWKYTSFPTSPNVAAVQFYINLGYVLW